MLKLVLDVYPLLCQLELRLSWDLERVYSSDFLPAAYARRVVEHCEVLSP